jgi:hypothetical protein
MIGRIIFLSASAYLAYRYIARSNRKAREVRGKTGTTEILPAEAAAREPVPAPKALPSGSATIEAGRPVRSTAQLSSAAEPNPGR